MKKITLLPLLILPLFIYSCSNTPKQTVVSQEVKECTYPDAPMSNAPLWICGAKVEGVAVSAVGTAKASAAGVNFMLQQASSNARVALAQQISTEVTAMVKNFVETTGSIEADNETVDEVASLTSKIITHQSLVGTRIYKQITSPKGNLYVLVGFDRDSYSSYLNNNLNTSYGSNTSQWQKVMSEKSFEELKESLSNANS